ncbi:unnamed protein product [Closterium sp. Yama58-4]|nr:unnamed protein product [Closterium sp. Yama58-4]
MGNEANTGDASSSSDSNSMDPAGYPGLPEGAATSASAGNDTSADASNSTAETSIIPGSDSTGSGNTRAPTSISPAGNSAVAGNSTGGGNGARGGNFTGANSAIAPSSSTTPGGNSSDAGNGTEGGALQNVTGAAGNGTEGGAVRYFTVGQEAFVWGSPLVTFFRQQATRAALNAFSFANTTAVVGTTNVALPNVDTVYGGAFLYLRDQPMVLKTPYMGQGRYYSVGFFQTYYSDFSVNGSRANGPGPNTFTVVGPDWAGELPADLAPTVIRSPTNDALLLMRVVVSENVSNDLATAPSSLHLLPTPILCSAIFPLLSPSPFFPQSPTNDALLLMRVVVSENVSNDLATVLDLYSQVSLQSLSEALGGPAVPPLPNPPLPSSNLSEALQRMTLIGEGLQRDPPVNNSANNRVVRMVRWLV